MTMKIGEVVKVAPGNPFLQDLSSMGTAVGRNIMIMHMCHDGEHCDHLVVWDQYKGEKVRIDFD
jgi:Fe2+ transport system protein FeoA